MEEQKRDKTEIVSEWRRENVPMLVVGRPSEWRLEKAPTNRRTKTK
jgi:hypothetical protein